MNLMEKAQAEEGLLPSNSRSDNGILILSALCMLPLFCHPWLFANSMFVPMLIIENNNYIIRGKYYVSVNLTTTLSWSAVCFVCRPLHVDDVSF